MSKLSLFLLITAAFLIGSLIATAAVWYWLVVVPLKEAKESIESLPTAIIEEVGSVFDSDPSDPSESSRVDNAPADQVAEPIVISLASLSEGQQAMAKTLGITGDEIVITAGARVCAEGKLGQPRLDELVGGEAPSFSEGLQLLNCLRQ